jgi:hypothetical protein
VIRPDAGMQFERSTGKSKALPRGAQRSTEEIGPLMKVDLKKSAKVTSGAEAQIQNKASSQR